MRPELWVIWTAIVIMCTTIGGSVGSRYFPSQERLDEEYDAGYEDGWLKACPEPTTPNGQPGVARSANPSRDSADLEASARKGAGAGLSGGDDELPRWDETAEHLIELSRSHFESLARDAEPDSYPDLPLSHNRPAPAPGEDFPTSPIYKQLAAETARKPAPPPISPGDGAAVPGPVLGAQGRAEGSIPSAGPGSDPWDQLAEQLGDPDDPEILEWSIRADAARCGEISRELRQLAKTLETL